MPARPLARPWRHEHNERARRHHRSALRYPDFRWLLSALAVSQIGDWLYNLALVVLVYDRTHSALWAGVTTAARVVPVVVLGPLGGVLADRFDRRRIMIMCDLARMGLMVLLAAVAAFQLPIVLAPVIAAAATAAAAPYVPCVAAVTPHVVEDADLPGANAARSAVTGAGIVLGPALGGVLLLLGSPASAFALNARPPGCPRRPCWLSAPTTSPPTLHRSRPWRTRYPLARVGC